MYIIPQNVVGGIPGEASGLPVVCPAAVHEGDRQQEIRKEFCRQIAGGEGVEAKGIRHVERRR
jgi:hypothetical protein